VRRVPTSLVHELGTEQPTHCPGDDQDRRDQVESHAKAELGTPASRADQPGGHPAEQSSVARQAAMQMARMSPGFLCVALRAPQVGDHVHGAGTYDRSDDDPDERA